MRSFYTLITFFAVVCQLSAQTITLGSPLLEDYLRRQQLLGKVDSTLSFTLRPLNIGKGGLNIDSTIFDKDKYFPEIASFFKGAGSIKLLPAEVRLNYDSNHPYLKNDGAMIRARGAQTLISAGFYAEVGPLSIQFKPEYVYAENKDFETFSQDHFDIIWARRYVWFNRSDIPEKFGDQAYKKFNLGQSSIRLNKWGLSLGISNENLWWGPATRNSIMMSNNAEGFLHFTFNTTRPIKTKIGSFEWQFITGRLESSGFPPSDTTRTLTNRRLFVPKFDDWRYLQAFTFTYSPKWISGLSLGAVRWVQAYSTFIRETNDYFPALSNLFRNNDNNTGGRDESQRDQAAGVFLRWRWKDAKAEIYAEFHRNDASANFRDLILDSDHTRASTIGIHKLFDTKKPGTFWQLNWEWNQLAQTGGRLVRDGLSWYIHSRVRDGFTNNGEVLGAAIGPGSNAHYLSLARVRGKNRFGGAFERVTNNNDFLRFAFEDSGDFRRYWVDYNIHAFADWEFNNFLVSGNITYIRSLNYQYELFDIPFVPPFFVPGTDRGNLHMEFKIAYLLK